MIKENINRVELAGTVGSIRISEVSGQKVAQISLCTTYAYRTKSGEAIVDTAWHLVTAWEGAGIADVTTLKKGDFIHIEGRLRSKAYVGADNIERRLTEILASKLEIINNKD